MNLKEGKAFCFMSGPDEEAIRKAHAAIDFPSTRSPRSGASPVPTCAFRNPRSSKSERRARPAQKVR
ncbi:MAG: hypothetical protein AB7V40_02725, partial [Methyloceanibacter sp.]